MSFKYGYPVPRSVRVWKCLHWKLNETITQPKTSIIFTDTYAILVRYIPIYTARKWSCSFGYFFTVYPSIQMYAFDKGLDFLLLYNLLNFILAAGMCMHMITCRGIDFCIIRQHGSGFSLYTLMFFLNTD